MRDTRMKAKCRSRSGSKIELSVLDISPIGCLLDRVAWSAQPDDRILIQLEGLGFQPARVSWVEDDRVGIELEQLLHEAVLERLKDFTALQGVVFIGRAQEKTGLFRTEKRRRPDGGSYPWIVRTTGVVNQFYFYCVDADFGPFFIKFCSYFPYREALHQRSPLGATASSEGRDRVHRDGQRLRRRR